MSTPTIIDGGRRLAGWRRPHGSRSRSRKALSWSQAYDVAYAAARPIWEKAIAESGAPRVVAIRELAAAQRGAALDLLEAMIKPERSSS